MTAPLKEVVTSWGFVFVAGAVLWPPRAVYWEDVAVYVGETLTLGSVGLLAVSLWGSTDDDKFTFYMPPVTLVLVGTATTVFNASLLL